MKKISKSDSLSDVMGLPCAEKILAKHKVPCLSCPYAKMEMEKLKIEDICKMYGIGLDSLLKDLNRK